MAKVKAYFMERMARDPKFRWEVEQAELGQIEPEFPDSEGGEERDLAGQEAQSINVESVFEEIKP